MSVRVLLMFFLCASAMQSRDSSDRKERIGSRKQRERISREKKDPEMKEG